MDQKFEPLHPPMSTTSSEDLLEEKHQLEDEFLEDAGLLHSHQRASRSWKKALLPVLCHIVLIMIYTAGTLVLLDRNNKKWTHGPNLIHCRWNLKTIDSAANANFGGSSCSRSA
jgi:hypothetical protein